LIAAEITTTSLAICVHFGWAFVHNAAAIAVDAVSTLGHFYEAVPVAGFFEDCGV